MHGRNNRLSRWGMQGVFATPDARAPRDVRGQTLAIRFEIVDKRPLPPAQGAVHGDTAQAQRHGPYTVAVSLQVRSGASVGFSFCVRVPERWKLESDLLASRYEHSNISARRKDREQY